MQHHQTGPQCQQQCISSTSSCFDWLDEVYRILPKKSPTCFSSRHDLDWGGGLFSNMHFPSNISPPLAPICSRRVEGRHYHWSCTAGNIQSLLFFFLQKIGSEMTCQVNSNRRRLVLGKGLVPCVYIFRGKQKHLDRLISVFARLEVPS